MSRRQLTHKQHAFLEFLRAHVREEKVWPTYREIVDYFNYRSPNSVTQNLQALAKKGFLRRDYNGYHLVDREGKDGSLPLRGTIRDGEAQNGTSSERLTLTGLFPGLTGHHALRLDASARQDPALRDAEYVFLGDNPGEGDLALVLHDGAVILRRVGADGRLTDPAGVHEALAPDETEVLGRYAGHAGPYGLDCQVAQTHTATVDASASFS
jgi:repressor LexA